MSDIASRVKAIIVDKLGVDENEVTPEASFTNDLGADSLDTVELIMEFEKEFNMGIPDDQAESICASPCVPCLPSIMRSAVPRVLHRCDCGPVPRDRIRKTVRGNHAKNRDHAGSGKTQAKNTRP